mgnify:FL=1
MDRALKERIIGAVVLVIVVVLVVPVFLDGPQDNSETVSEGISLPGQANDGTRTVVLDRDRSEPVPESGRTSADEPLPETVDEPSPETVAEPSPETVAEPVPVAETARAAPSGDEPAGADPDSDVVEPAAAAESPAAPVVELEPAPDTPTRSATGMWAVQLGSFSNEVNAERLAADLRQEGFAAFLSKLSTNNGELHRVRVGPQRDREAAEIMLARLERSGQKGQVVPHP